MGFLNMRPDFEKNGPGVSKQEPKKNRFFHFWELLGRKFFRIINLNIIYFLSCLTIVGIGPATAGFTYVLRNFAREEHAFVWLDYKDAVKKNWKRSFVVTLLNTVIFIMLICAIIFYYNEYMSGGNSFYLIPLMLMAGATVIFFFMQFYIYLMIVTFDLTFMQLYKNAFIFSFYALPSNIITTVAIALATVFVIDIRGMSMTLSNITLEIPISYLGMLLIPTVYLGFVGFVTVYNAYNVIDKVMIKPMQAQAAETEKEEPICSDEPLQNNGGKK